MAAKIRSPDIWFEDGSIVLQAELTQFRVYRGILSANSPIFRDMFSLPQPNEGELVEGCPVVTLFDSAVDLSHFLRAIHDAGYYDRTKTKEFSLVASVLRLSSKYNVEYLRERAIAHLTECFPTTLGEWNLRHNANIMETFPARPFLVLQLARKFDIPAMLPAAMYCCACTPDIKSLCDGITSIDGSHIELDWEDKRSCLLARQKLYDAQRIRLFGCLLDLPTCARCDSGKLEYLRRLEHKSIQSGFPYPFQQKFDLSFDQAVCKECYNRSFSSFSAARQELWDDLPSLFDLPSWAELRG